MARPASFLLVLVAVAFCLWWHPLPPSDLHFVQIRPSLYRLNFWFRYPLVGPMPVAVWLIESSPKSWILIDGGVPTASSQQAILTGLQSMLSSTEDTLRLVLVTHGHSDHTGVFSKLLGIYTDAKVAFHEDEQPFLSGGTGSYGALLADNKMYTVLAESPSPTDSTLIPSSRAFLLKGYSGNVSDVFPNVSWLPNGILEYHAVPGHAPGQVFFYHKPTGSVIAADAITQMTGRQFLSGVDETYIGHPVFSYNGELTRRSQQRLAALPGIQTFFPSHDAKTGISPEDLKEFIKMQGQITLFGFNLSHIHTVVINLAERAINKLFHRHHNAHV